jgi:hypothetical protein
MNKIPPSDRMGELITKVIIPLTGFWVTVPELLFEKKGLILELQKVLVSHHVSSDIDSTLP